MSVSPSKTGICPFLVLNVVRVQCMSTLQLSGKESKLAQPFAEENQNIMCQEPSKYLSPLTQ